MSSATSGASISLVPAAVAAASGHVLLFRQRDLLPLNTSLSRDAVDAWLKLVTQRCTEILQKNGMDAGNLARLNGSDFIVLLKGQTGPQVMGFAQELRKAFDDAYWQRLRKDRRSNAAAILAALACLTATVSLISIAVGGTHYQARKSSLLDLDASDGLVGQRPFTLRAPIGSAVATRAGARIDCQPHNGRGRNARGWTLDQLADVAGVSRRMLINVEQETSLRAPDPYAKVASDGSSYRGQPDIRLSCHRANRTDILGDDTLLLKRIAARIWR